MSCGRVPAAIWLAIWPATARASAASSWYEATCGWRIWTGVASDFEAAADRSVSAPALPRISRLAVSTIAGDER